MVLLNMELICSGLNGKLHSAHFPLLLSQISSNGEIEIISPNALLLLNTSLYMSSVCSFVLELPPQFSFLLTR